MNHRAATSKDLLIIKEILDLNNLPSDDIEEHLQHFIVIEDKASIIGVVGLEIYDALGLLRSMVVIPEFRGNGIANQLYSLIAERAKGFGVNTLYLLTETAVDYFINLGFAVQSRSEVPWQIRGTQQFSELCPSSATVMSCAVRSVKRP